MSNSLVPLLLELEGVESIHVETTVTVTHRQEHTGEYDDVYNPIRERVIEEDEFEEIADRLDWDYYGTVDVPSDYRLKDRFTKHQTVEAGDDNP